VSDDHARRLVKLREAFHSGALDKDTYQAAVAALAERTERRAEVKGSGVIAQRGGVAAGPNGVAVGGDIHGNVYVGPHPLNPAEALTVYRRVLVAGCRQMPLRGVDMGASDPGGAHKQLDLDQVYVALDTTTQVPVTDDAGKGSKESHLLERGETRTLSLLEASARNRCLVILGRPGSGKSTFINHLGLCLALQGLEPEGGWLKRLLSWPEAEADLIPISVVLRDFARFLPENERKAEPRHLWSFVVDRLKNQNLTFAKEPLHDALEDGKAIVLLDGLDEIPTRARRAFIRDAVAVFATRYPKSRLVVTCRTLSYEDKAWRLEDFPAFEVASFDEPKVDRFVEAWYSELQRLGQVRREESGGLARRLREAVRRPDLWRLAPNPLLLTVMALVHTHKGRLPDARAQLYEDTVDILLWRWEGLKAGGENETPGVHRLLLEAERTDVDLKRVLGQLAFEVHRKGGATDGESVADIGEFRLERALAELHPQKSRDWANKLIETMRLRAGLLLERVPEVYTFPHRTFQEYLAGAHLAAQGDFARQASKLVAEGPFWREVILLAVGRLVYLGGDTDKPLALVGELCPQKHADDEVAWRKAWLAGEVLNEIGLNRVKDSHLGVDFLDRVRHRLPRLFETEMFMPVERAAAGDTLARLGDPRPGVGLDANGLPDIAWCDIEPGPFIMGNTEEQAEYDDERPQFTCNLIRQPYRIGKYSVTNEQFNAFVKDGGYTEQWRQCWTDAGWAWKGDSSGPEKQGGVYDLPNHPVVRVSWYEAIAFCNWLSEQLGYRVSLPTEAQWERAARHTDRRVYPWGNKEEPGKRCNMYDTGIGKTSAVGIFPAGNAECRAADMAGNVLEWCSTKWLESYEDYERKADNTLDGEERRVLRGGAFDFSELDVRCTYRVGSLPNSRGLNLGFRVVASPSTSGL
jgi:formylglycine-generating enzyme required for sulfatase activity